MPSDVVLLVMEFTPSPAALSATCTQLASLWRTHYLCIRQSADWHQTPPSTGVLSLCVRLDGKPPPDDRTAFVPTSLTLAPALVFLNWAPVHDVPSDVASGCRGTLAAIQPARLRRLSVHIAERGAHADGPTGPPAWPG